MASVKAAATAFDAGKPIKKSAGDALKSVSDKKRPDLYLTKSPSKKLVDETPFKVKLKPLPPENNEKKTKKKLSETIQEGSVDKTPWGERVKRQQSTEAPPWTRQTSVKTSSPTAGPPVPPPPPPTGLPPPVPNTGPGKKQKVQSICLEEICFVFQKRNFGLEFSPIFTSYNILHITLYDRFWQILRAFNGFVHKLKLFSLKSR